MSNFSILRSMLPQIREQQMTAGDTNESVGSIAPQWVKWRQQVAKATGTGKWGDNELGMRGGPSRLGSNQLRGERTGVTRRPGLYDQEADVALENAFAQQGVGGQIGLKDELIQEQGGTARHAYEALMRALRG